MTNAYAGPVYYSPQANRFFQVREQLEGSCRCGGFVPFYEDSMTVSTEQELSNDFIDQCEQIAAIDQCQHAEICLMGNEIAWRVKS